MSDTPKSPPGPIARHGRARSGGLIGRLLAGVAVTLAVVLVSAVGVAAYIAYDLSSTFSADAVELEGDVPPDISAHEGPINILLAGLDTCEPEYAHLFPGRCDDPGAEGNLNDVNLLLHVSAEPRRVTAISFPRDLMLSVPECTDEEGNTRSAMSRAMLNSVYSHAGLSCIAKTVGELSGMDIPYAATTTWGGVIEITEAIGGVDVCIENGISDVHTNLNLPPGNHTLKGYEALQFLRTRHGVVGGGDLARIDNQQVYMSALARKIMSEEVLSNPGTVLSLARTTLENVDPSTSLTNPATLIQMALAVKDVPLEEINFVRYPTLTDPYDENRVVPDYPAAEQLFAALEANQPIGLTEAENGGAVVPEGEAPPQGEAAPPEGEAPADGTAPEQSAPPEDGTVELPGNVHGGNAATVRCSNGVGVG